MSKLHLALDYNGTYTTDPGLWADFIYRTEERGHTVTFVTMRRPSEALIFVDNPVIYTSREAKLKYCLKQGITFDIWIDDNPKWLFNNA